MNKEIEEQRLGRNKDTIVNRTYINSGKYRKIFDKITNDIELSRLLYRLAKDMLFHRSGTKMEDMYWIDLDTLEIFAKETDGTIEKRVVYSAATEAAIKLHEHILTVHTHPDGFPPSIEDINSNFEHGYQIGIVLGHDGTLYMYSANEIIDVEYYKLVVARYKKQGYNECEAQICALNRLQDYFDINFREVTDYDV